MPREHGAYAQLGFPLVTGLVYAGAQPGAWAFTAAAVALFLAHEPMSVIAGLRGVRLRDALVGPARRRLWLLAGLTTVSLVAASVLAPWDAWRAALVPALPGVVLIPLFLAARVKTLGGELVAALAFSASLMPVALSGGADWPAAWVAAAVWYGASSPAIVSVHAVKALHKGRPRGPWLRAATLAAAVLVAAAAVVVSVALPYPSVRALAVLPPAVAVAGVAAVSPHPRHLKRIGWTMVVANTGALVLLIVL
jgi:hypothetical protein